MKANYDFSKGERGKFYCHPDAEIILPVYSERDRSVTALKVWFDGDMLSILLDDFRTISVDLTKIKWLNWLKDATPEQRVHWSIEPGGFAVYWENLDDGIEISHLLGIQPI